MEYRLIATRPQPERKTVEDAVEPDELERIEPTIAKAEAEKRLEMTITD